MTEWTVSCRAVDKGMLAMVGGSVYAKGKRERERERNDRTALLQSPPSS
jgi:hypothetical protein